MKKILFFAIAALICSESFAQIGVVGGLTSTSTNFQGAYKDLSTKMISQYHVGLTYKIGLGNILAIQPALLYNVKGAKLDELSGIADINFKTGYLELPVQVQAGVGLGKVFRVYGLAEPFLGYAVSNKVTTNDTVDNTWDNIKNRFEYGLALGGGVELFKHLQVSIKYFWNFGTVYGSEISFKSVTQQISSANCGGISLSATVLL